MSKHTSKLEEILDKFAEEAELPLEGSGEYILVKADYERLREKTKADLLAWHKEELLRQLKDIDLPKGVTEEEMREILEQTDPSDWTYGHTRGFNRAILASHEAVNKKIEEE